VRTLGGRLAIESSPGTGARLQVLIPKDVQNEAR
jgi:signal transduction histidine kinase